MNSAAAPLHLNQVPTDPGGEAVGIATMEDNNSNTTAAKQQQQLVVSLESCKRPGESQPGGVGVGACSTWLWEAERCSSRLCRGRGIVDGPVGRYLVLHRLRQLGARRQRHAVPQRPAVERQPLLVPHATGVAERAWAQWAAAPLRCLVAAAVEAGGPLVLLA